jgi:RimJ/RimL family protein N-acetyltransferase
MKFTFRAMTRGDIPLMHRWLNLPHVAEWWGGGDSLEDVEKEYGEYIDGIEPIHPYIAYADGVAIGHLQWMRYRDYPKYMQILRIDDPSAANCDVFIADEHFLHRGVGAPMIRAFVDTVIFADGVTTCFIDPDARNKIAIRAYEKAGFRFVRHIENDGEGDPVHLMCLGNRPET